MKPDIFNFFGKGYRIIYYGTVIIEQFGDKFYMVFFKELQWF